MNLVNIAEDEKRKRIVDDLDVNCFVEAGAGAGKTTIIKNRIVNQLKSGVKPEEIVAITFTKAAARELKERIFDAVEKASVDNNNTIQEREYLKAALDELDRMQISTIHGFCHRLLEERCFDVGLPMGFELMQEDDEKALFDDFFVKWAEQNVNFTDWESFNSLVKGEDNKRRTSFSRMRRLAMDLAKLAPDMQVTVAGDWSKIKEHENVAKNLLGEIEIKLDSVAEEAKDVLGVEVFKEIPKDNLLKSCTGVRDALKNGDVLDSLSALNEVPDKDWASDNFPIKISKSSVSAFYYNSGKAKTKKQADNEAVIWLGPVNEKKAKVREFLNNKKDDIKKYVLLLKLPLYRRFVELAEKAAKDFRQSFPSGQMTNDLLLLRTLELVRESEDVRSYFARKFKYYYVDEFQDTDHIQESFIRLLTQKESEKDTLRDGALFVVGDPKQSIYRFRGAEPEIYFGTKKWMKSLDNAIVVELSNNYRSNNEIIDWVNSSFNTKAITPGSAYVPMNADPNKLINIQGGIPKNLIHGVYQYDAAGKFLSADDSKPDKKAEKINSDTHNLCDLIEQMVSSGLIMKDGKPQKIEYSDFLLLSTNMPGMDEYAKAMRERGIPFVMDSKTKASEDYYIGAFIRMYAWLANCYDKKAIEGAMETLAVSGAKLYEKNVKILDIVRKETKGYSAYGCINYLMEHKSLFIPKDADIDSYSMATLQRRLQQMTEAVTVDKHADHLSVLAALRKYQMNDIERELVMEASPNAVHFMNLHKAKGLEGNIVIITNRIENRGFRDSEYRDGKKFYPAITDMIPGNIKTVSWCAYEGDKNIKEKAEAEDKSERIRLEYVAATRAKEALIFMDNLTKEGTLSLFIEGYNLENLPKIKESVEFENGKEAEKCSTMASGDGSEAEEKDAASKFPVSDHEKIAKERQTVKDCSKPVFSSESPSDYEDDNSGKKSRNSVAAIDDDMLDGDSDIEGVKGNIFGTVMHRSFELFIERRKDEGLRDLLSGGLTVAELCIKQAILENAEKISLDDRGKYYDFLMCIFSAFEEWYTNSGIETDAEQIYTELPFSYCLEGDESVPIWMHGEADLVIKKKDGSVHIIDYKSDDDDGYSEEEFKQRLIGKYTPQIAAYRRAISRVLNIEQEKITAEIISFSYMDTEGKPIRIRHTDI